MPHGPTIRPHRRHDVLVVTVMGVFTARAIAAVTQMTHAELYRRDARSVVVDLSGALQAIDTSDPASIAKRAAESQQVIAQPLVYVVTGAMEEHYRAICQHMAGLGFLRVVTTDAGAALRWASLCRAWWRSPGRALSLTAS